MTKSKINTKPKKTPSLNQHEYYGEMIRGWLAPTEGRVAKPERQ